MEDVGARPGAIAGGGPAVTAALDIGGTKIAAGLVSGAGGLVHRVVVPTPARCSADEVFGAVTQALAEVAEHRLWPGVRRLGIGCAGPVDVGSGTVSPVNIPAWRGFGLVCAVEELECCRGVEAVLSGDAIAMAAGEHWRGAAEGCRNALCMVVSTGIGAGLVLQGRPYFGTTGNAGHLGHVSVDLDGERCPCGARGCVERIAAGPAVARAAGQPDAQAAAEAARLGDPTALAAFERAGTALAAAAAGVAALVEIDVVVVGGGVAQAGDLLLEPFRRRLGDYATLDFTSGLKVVPAALGSAAGLIGAASIAQRFSQTQVKTLL